MGGNIGGGARRCYCGAAQQGAVKIFTPPDGGTISSFKIVHSLTASQHLIGIIESPFSMCDTVQCYYNTGDGMGYGNFVFCSGGTNTLEYLPDSNSFINIGSAEYNGYGTCHDAQPYPNWKGVSWVYISPINNSSFYATWEYDGCGRNFGNVQTFYNLYMGNCSILSQNNIYGVGESAFILQDAFFHPTGGTIFYYFDDSYQLSKPGLYICHLGDSCHVNWQLLKAEPNFSYFYIPPDFPNILFFTANDTLWQSPDPIAYWNTAITANITSIAYFPDGKFFYALCSDSAGKGLYRSVDSGKTFIQLDKSLFYSLAVDTATGAVYAGENGVLYRSDDSGKTFYMFNNTFINKPIISIAANVYGKLICAVSNGLYQITNSSVAPLLVSPKNDSMWVQQYSTFKWYTIPQASSYRVQIATDSLFTNIVLDYKNVTDSMKQLDSLQPLTRYYWRVSATLNSPATSVWSQTLCPSRRCHCFRIKLLLSHPRIKKIST